MTESDLSDRQWRFLLNPTTMTESVLSDRQQRSHVSQMQQKSVTVSVATSRARTFCNFLAHSVLEFIPLT